MDFLFNEESQFCVLPEAFTDYHTSLLDTNSVDNTPNQSPNPPPNPNKPITEDEIAKAKDLLERAKQQNLTSNNTGFFVK
jgi:hypothetical protein